MTDAELILASQRDPARFRELYDRLADDVLAYLYRRVLDAEVAADLLAETFAVAFERRGRFTDRGKPGAAWIYGIAAKELSHWYRRRAVELRAVNRLGMRVPELDDESIARIEALVDSDASLGRHRRALDPAGRRALRGRAAGGRRARLRRDRRAAELHRRSCAHPRPSRPGAPRTTDGGERMSQIPYVNRLGDELERAAERSLPQPRRSRRRLGLLALVGALLVAGTALASGVLSGDAETQATAPIACYDGAGGEFSRSVAVVPQHTGSAAASPVDICRREFALAHGPSGPLVACGAKGGVAVILGQTASDCAAAGFGRLDPRFGRARVRAAAMESKILALEGSANCIDPRSLARRLRRLLDRSGWTATVRLRGGDADCGTVSQIAGDGRRYISWDLQDGERRLSVWRVAPRRVTDLLYSADRSLLVPLFRESGAACLTFPELRERIRERFAAKRLDASVRRIPLHGALDDDDGRWTRYRQGCAILAGGQPDGADAVIADVFVKR